MDILNKDIYNGYTVKDVSKYTIAALLGYQAINYTWWHYKNRQVVAKARKVLEQRN